MSSGSAKSLFLSVPSRLDALGPIRGRVLDYVGQLGFAEQAAEDLVLCVHEAVSNAIVHGNREAEELPVDVLIEALDGGVRVTVRNHGPGFEFDQLADRRPTDEPRGRGMKIIRSLAADIAWNDQGRELVFVMQAPR